MTGGNDEVRPFGSLPAPARTAINAPYWDALERGRLLFQECEAGDRWLPPRAHCPRCLSDAISWTPAAGGARLLSWVIYHRAYDSSFERLLPYNVALVELEEGPRLLTNVVELDASGLAVGMRLRLQIEREEGVALARFAPLHADAEQAAG